MRLRAGLFALFTAAALGLANASPAAAHPLGNFSLNYHSTIRVAPNALTVAYVMDQAEVPTYQLKQRIDANLDGVIDGAERASFAATQVALLQSNLALTINGAPVALSPGPAELVFAPGQSGLDTLRLSLVFTATRAPGTGSRVTFSDNNDRERLGWREVIAIGDGVTLGDSTLPTTDSSDALRRYPENRLSTPLRIFDGAFTVAATGTQNAQTTPVDGKRPFGASRYDTYMSRWLSVDLGATALLAALVLGALHALEPGHGKSLATAYLVGARATPYHALLLGLSVTITHTLSVFALGLITLFLSRVIVPEQLFPYLGLASAAIALAVGALMLWQALQAYRTPVGDHQHNIDADTGQLRHAHGGGMHRHLGLGSGGALRVRSVLAIGVSGGLVPCPAALIVLLSAVSVGQAGFGIVLVLVFSSGLALVLSAISLLVVYGKRWLNRRPQSRITLNSKWLAVLPIVSALIVLGAGGYLLANVIAYFST